MFARFYFVGSIKSSATHKGTTINSDNQQLADELHKSVIRKSEKRKVCSSFKDNLWSTDLADMQLISKYNKGNVHRMLL